MQHIIRKPHLRRDFKRSTRASEDAPAAQLPFFSTTRLTKRYGSLWVAFGAYHALNRPLSHISLQTGVSRCVGTYTPAFLSGV